MDSGWDIKHMVRLMVTSGTYRQSLASLRRSDKEKDPYNRLLRPPVALPAGRRIVRDNALAVSGLLVDKIGGPSVKPYQPAGYWDALNFPTRDVADRQGRRPVSPRAVHLVAADASCTRACWRSTPRRARKRSASGLDPTSRSRRWCC